jgi:hypothetical protein
MNDFAHALVEGGSENLVPPVAVIPFVQVGVSVYV